VERARGRALNAVARRTLDRFFGWLCRTALALFFRRIEVVGRDRLPGSGPRIVVGNHVNGLIDPLFVLGPLGVPARLLGKSTLWRIPILAQLMDLAGVLPVYRAMDAGADRTRNEETFARCHEELARGGALSIFPEGTSHDDPRLKPLKTGAARIALEAERRFGPLGLLIVPFGLVFEERTRFRSRVLVVVGEPLDPAPEVELARRDEPAAVRVLTARVAAALERVTLNYDSWEEARLIELAAGVLDRGSDGQRRRGLAAGFVLQRRLADGLDRLRAEYPAEVESAVAAARDYERLRRTAGLTDEQVVARPDRRTAAAFVGRTLARMLIASPVAVLGTALNLVPWLAVDAISRRVRELNQVATYKLFPSLVVYPLTWGLETLAAGHWLGCGSAAALALVAPPAGWVALRWHERRETLWRETRAFLVLRNRRRVAEELRARRAAMASAAAALVERWRALQGASDDSSRA
jgi:1-acyl-sn-glycerol-3-phosphate acyltransferase